MYSYYQEEAYYNEKTTGFGLQENHHKVDG